MGKHSRVLFFALLREITGIQELNIELNDDATIHDLQIEIAIKFPSIQGILSNSLIAMNHEYVAESDRISDNAEIAIFPRVSGGENDSGHTLWRIQTSEIDVDSIIQNMKKPTTGAICTFYGIVRGFTERGDWHQTDYLEYEAYQPMAEAKLYQIIGEIRELWPGVDSVAIIQRIGRIDPGVPSVFIACSAAHRDTGVFDAVHYAINRIKEIVPVWKKETGSNGQVWVEGDYSPTPGE